MPGKVTESVYQWSRLLTDFSVQHKGEVMIHVSVFSGATMIFLVFQVAKYNMLSMTAFSLGACVLGMLAWSFVGGAIHRPPPALPGVMREGVTEGQVRALAEKATPYINKVLKFSNRVLSGKDVVMSVSVGAGCMILGKALALVSILGLAYTLVVLAFSVPKVYDMYHDQIDGVIDIVRQKVTQIHDTYLAKILKRIPRAATPAESSSASKMD